MDNRMKAALITVGIVLAGALLWVGATVLLG
jgi:hypothetical protein